MIATHETIAQRKLAWIVERLNAGRTVYLSTAYKSTKLTRKSLAIVRARGENLEVAHGKQWLNHNYSRLSAE